MWPNVVSSERKWSTEKLFLYSLFLCKPWQENHYTLKIQFILPAMVGILHLFENFPLFLAEIKKKEKKQEWKQICDKDNQSTGCAGSARATGYTRVGSQ